MRYLDNNRAWCHTVQQDYFGLLILTKEALRGWDVELELQLQLQLQLDLGRGGGEKWGRKRDTVLETVGHL